MILSILIPAVYERGYPALLSSLNEQATGQEVEILTLFDNRKRSTGRKRQALLDAAQGSFIACLDDDDSVSTAFVAELLPVIAQNPDADVIVYNSCSRIDSGNAFTVRTGIEFENEQCHKVNGLWADITRKPWHWCTWSARLAKQASFPDGYIDDDWFWLRQMLPLVKKQARIDKTLHFYNHDPKRSLANQGKPTT